ncbi:hypothetical protein [Agromyces badenianii]|uniref:hypothetical protein n=1 Tax=Agromyces badenianii TaxID=2080742 RepID=UPI00196A39A1|nr:hypothetical protein [Agromyces badenianii]
MDRASVELRPIRDEDAEVIAAFLHAHLNTRVPVAGWRRLLSPPWETDSPNHGFQLVSDSAVVGVYVAVYSRRPGDHGRLPVCNLAAFCVLEPYRVHSFRLLRAIIGQRGYDFTDLSPSGNVVALNERLGFARLDGRTRLTLNLPAPGRRGIRVSDDPAVIERVLDGQDAVVYRDHRAGAARHLVVVGDDGEYSYLIVRKDRRKGIPVFATPIHVGGSRRLLRDAWPRVRSHLLLRHGAIATLAERRVLGFEPSLGVDVSAPRPRMFLSRGARTEAEVDYLYSELALVEW